MLPRLDHLQGEESGIKRVVESYHKHAAAHGIEYVGSEGEAEVTHAHIDGTSIGNLGVLSCHGLYWTEDFVAEAWQMEANAKVIASVRRARIVTVPSAWVAEPFQRDMRFAPEVLPHGIDWDEWQGRSEREGYVLWNKNRDLDVCNPRPVLELAWRKPGIPFVTTFYPRGKELQSNVQVIGLRSFSEMKNIVMHAGVYLSTTKETFGRGTLEAMAAGVPILGFDYGGNRDLVKHGVNGFLARPGDWDELAAGLDYCLAHWKTLGGNGREMARAWTWGAAMEKLAALYERAARPEPPTVSVVIPCHNYGTEEKLGRAISSAFSQTYHQLARVVVVDDGSRDASAVQGVVSSHDPGDGRITLIRQECSGVAAARNRGIHEASEAKYICCLDADDALEPRFLEMCVEELERDASLGIAYTRLRWVTPDGKTGTSDWPNDCDHDAQFAGRNQVPTACVFRREMWERLGGYKKRYCPAGAGEEDAEFWLRAMAAGYGAKRAGEEALFVYSMGAGQVSGNRKHRMTDWLAWHPWTRDERQPFASLKKPRKWSHPVRQYDEPEISVVIPVGPGHEALLEDALDSLEAQTFRRWEAIVVWDNESNWFGRYDKAYPYVHLANQDITSPFQPLGAGHSRNLGVKIARAPLLFFLDADDYLLPDCLSVLYRAHKDTGAAAYSDYAGMAYISDVAELAPDLQANIRAHEGDGWTVIGYRSAEYDCLRAQVQPTPERPYTWNLISTLLPKVWHDEAGGFDESMRTWEDVDYFWRMARQGRCFVRVPQELVAYRFYTGHRRELGVTFQQDKEAYLAAMNYMRDKYALMETKVCSSCKQQAPIAPPPAPPPVARTAARPSAAPPSPSDKDYVMVEFNSLNMADEPVVGIRTRFNYGYKGRGARFLMHREDQKLEPDRFQIYVSAPPTPVAEKLAAPPPAPINAPVESEGLADATSFTDVQVVVAALPGIGPELAAKLSGLGIKTVRDVMAMDVEALADLMGSRRKVNSLRAYVERRAA